LRQGKASEGQAETQGGNLQNGKTSMSHWKPSEGRKNAAFWMHETPRRRTVNHCSSKIASLQVGFAIIKALPMKGVL
jgi:hypothetical protein